MGDHSRDLDQTILTNESKFQMKEMVRMMMIFFLIAIEQERKEMMRLQEGDDDVQLIQGRKV